MKQKLFVIAILLSLLVVSFGTASAQGSKPPGIYTDPAALPKSMFVALAASGDPTNGAVPPVASADLLTLPTLINGNFEQGPGVGWTVSRTHSFPVIMSTATLVVPPHSGIYAAWLGGADNDISSVAQNFSVINPTHVRLWYWVGSQEASCGYDFGYILINDVNILHTWALCGPNNTGGWVPLAIDLSAYSGQTVKLTIQVETDVDTNSNLFIDDVYLYGTFADVPYDHWAWNYIEGLYNAGVTGGCGSGNYCPGTAVTRDQMAVFLLKGRHGSAYAPPAVGDTTGFNDVPTNHWSAAWIKQLAVEGITGGCGSGNYCPTGAVTRDQMAVFLLKAKYGSSYAPPPVGVSTGFGDVPTTHWAAAWIKQLAAEGITGGCGAGTYCPGSPVTRDQMAVFLVRTFGLAIP